MKKRVTVAAGALLQQQSAFSYFSLYGKHPPALALLLTPSSEVQPKVARPLPPCRR
jgi:hypothetical protein